ncbi:elongation factor G [Caulobacter ginsengisoli]|uniref:Elongation factor G n=1 Tax=Caulobacter ginsengisoli TaxID=400775 RepID=A0ABU0J0X0_9CAUL|nr:elongation factor G [Caulobacter ginsengisoli]MDQ0466862.1 elongation factor G [Caulobacter ginsengisoli]
MASRKVAAVRSIALIGPNGAGKTTLFEALLYAAGAVDRQAVVGQPGSVGDASPEARAAGQSVELNIASFDFMEDRYALIDCPGSVEFRSEMDHALPAVDLALVVIDSDPGKALLAQPWLKTVERLGIPHAIFVNRIDQARASASDLLAALQPVSATPVVARQIPIWKDEHVTGFIDLALERAFIYRPGTASEQVDIPAELQAEEKDARFHMLEQMSDYDDALMELLLSDETPDRDTVFADLIAETQAGQITPVFFGAALQGNGVRRLLKALRHDTPGPEQAAERLGAPGNSAYVIKASHAGQAGKMTYARVFGGPLNDGAELVLPNGHPGRVSGLFAVQGQTTRKIAKAEAGDIVALGKLEEAHAGDLLAVGKPAAARVAPEPRYPVYQIAIATKDRKDDVRLSGSLAKLLEEDTGLGLVHDAEAHEMRLTGQGEAHLRIALDRLRRRYGVEVVTAPPGTPYRETIRKAVTQRGRHKKQTGGHGQFGDVVLEIRPLARGEGFQFQEKITGGVVPRQWFGAVEQGVRDAMEKGPLGFPVVDVAVTLVDGSYHAVDSSEMAFRTAGRIGMSEGLALAQPILLEPIEKLTIYAPNTATSRITSTISNKRGQILGFDGREEWPGWDRIEVYMPHPERQDFIIDLRSMTQGLGSFEAQFDHMVELTGRKAEEVSQKARGGGEARA